MYTPRLKAYIMLLIVSVIWGIAGPVIKLTLKGLPPDIFLLYRFFISSIIAVVIFVFIGIKFPQEPKLIRNILVYGFFNSTATLGLLFWGTDKTSLLDMSLISLFGPILIILAGFIFLKEHITSKEKIGITIAFIGSVLLIIEPLFKNQNGQSGLWGNLLILASLISSAYCGVMLKKLLRQGISPSFLANFTFLIGFLTLLPFVTVKYGLGETFLIIKNTPFPYHLGVIYMAIFSGTIAYSLYNLGQKTIELSEAALFAYLHPIFSATIAVTILGDKLTLPVIIGSIITYIGVFIAEIKKKRYNSTYES